MRGPGQVHVPPGGPSTSGRSEVSEEEENFEPDIARRSPFRVPSEPERMHIQNDQNDSIPINLWYEQNGRFQPVHGIFNNTVIARGFIIGLNIDNYIRPIYNANHEIVILHESTKRIVVLTPEQAELLHINQPMPNNVPNESNMSPGPSRPSRDRRNRRRNQQRRN